jgi:hypothetical protein
MHTFWKSLVTASVVCLLLVALSELSRAKQDTTNVYSLALPGRNWSLNIPKWALTEGSHRVQADTIAFLGARDGNKKLKLSPVIINIRMGPATARGDAQALSDLSKKNLLKDSSVDPQSLKQFVYNNIPLIRYSVNISPGVPSAAGMVRGQVLVAFYVKDDVWIVVGMNFLEFKKEDEQYFHSFLDALKIASNAETKEI